MQEIVQWIWRKAGLRDADREGDLSAEERFSVLRRTLFFLMTLVAMVPLGVTAGLSFHEYRDLLILESRNHTSWTAERAQKMTHAFLLRLKSAINFIASQYTFAELSDPNRLNQVFNNLKKEYEGLVDLSVLDADGIQRAYAGPYNLTGKDYSGSTWFHQALTRTPYVSDVFTGFRNLPHFVVAVSRKDPNSEQYWVLRASIDTDTIEHFLANITSADTDDIFLINNAGKLQTSSLNYGPALSETPLNSRTLNVEGITIFEVEQGRERILRAMGRIRGTPWILILDQKDVINKDNWAGFRWHMLAILISSAFVSSAVILRIAGALARRLRAADEHRAKLMADAEHQSKLASIGRLAAGVAHEINNPLAVINEKAGLLEDLLSLEKGSPRQEKFLAQVKGVQEAVSRCRTITHRLLGFARRMETRFEAVDLNDIMNEVVSFVAKDASYRNITFEMELFDEIPCIMGDRGQLQQVFLNLVNNAIDAAPEGGRIIIRSDYETAPGKVRVDVIDNGPGIPPDLLPKIFEPFFTTKTKGERKGTGLGLSITYGLVRKMNGEVTVESAPGRGTIFSVRFPRRACNEE